MAKPNYSYAKRQKELKKKKKRQEKLLRKQASKDAEPTNEENEDSTLPENDTPASE